MALKATIFKAELQIADMDRSYYADHSLTVARHPSETDERMMVRLLAFALHAEEALAFGKGLSTEDEPDLWLRDLTGVIDLWIDVGLPDEKRIRRACGRAEQVYVYSYGGHGADLWWKQTGADLERNANLTIMNVPRQATQAMAQLAQRSMKLQCTIQEGQIWIADDRESVPLELVRLKSAIPALR
ncbi:MAG TPA: YaeQ family protein [Burkholderiales bacterium]|nr:YaeQ family protein [Burkholderiales bacterium]